MVPNLIKGMNIKQQLNRNNLACRGLKKKGIAVKIKMEGWKFGLIIKSQLETLTLCIKKPGIEFHICLHFRYPNSHPLRQRAMAQVVVSQPPMHEALIGFQVSVWRVQPSLGHFRHLVSEPLEGLLFHLPCNQINHMYMFVCIHKCMYI